MLLGHDFWMDGYFWTHVTIWKHVNLGFMFPTCLLLSNGQIYMLKKFPTFKLKILKNKYGLHMCQFWSILVCDQVFFSPYEIKIKII